MFETAGVLVSRECFEIMKPFILVARAFGLCPVTFQARGRQYVINMSKKSIVYGYILAGVFVSCALYGLVNDFSLDEGDSIRMKSKKTRYITCCDIFIVVILVAFGVFSTPFKMKQYKKIQECFNIIDGFMPLINGKRYKNHSRNFIISILCAFTAIVIFDCSVWDALSKKKDSSGLFWKNYFAFYILYFIVIMQEIVFWHTVFYVNIRLTLMNKAILEEVKQVTGIKERILKSKSVISTLSATELFKNNISTAKVSKYFKNDFSKINTLEKILTLTQIYEKICEAVDHVNSAGGIGIVIILLSCLLHLIVTPYFLLFEISNNGNKIFMSLQTVWLFTHTFRLLLIVEPCHQCLFESNKTIHFVCELMTYAYDEEVKRALSVFALQLSYCKIRFSTCGLVEIDRSLITAVVGAVTTYLVILFQFNNN